MVCWVLEAPLLGSTLMLLFDEMRRLAGRAICVLRSVHLGMLRGRRARPRDRRYRLGTLRMRVRFDHRRWYRMTQLHSPKENRNRVKSTIIFARHSSVWAIANMKRLRKRH